MNSVLTKEGVSLLSIVEGLRDDYYSKSMSKYAPAEEKYISFGKYMAYRDIACFMLNNDFRTEG